MKANDWQDTIAMAASAIEDLLETADEQAGCWADVPARLRALTATPAPAVQKDVEAVVGLLESGEWAEHCTKSELGQRLESAITALIGITPPAPDAINTAIRYLKDTLVACNRFNYCADAVNRVENACRAAMRAQPVGQGCEWTYDEHDSKWDSGCGDAWMFCDGGPTENGVKFCQSCGKPVLLAAAPEGGNEK